uniref:Uncharacterized protein n=1 Tax=Plectus sambesii TaxID=2011161 RepID=A0A914W5I2_9BILA
MSATAEKSTAVTDSPRADDWSVEATQAGDFAQFARSFFIQRPARNLSVDGHSCTIACRQPLAPDFTARSRFRREGCARMALDVKPCAFSNLSTRSLIGASSVTSLATIAPPQLARPSRDALGGPKRPVLFVCGRSADGRAAVVVGWLTARTGACVLGGACRGRAGRARRSGLGLDARDGGSSRRRGAAAVALLQNEKKARKDDRRGRATIVGFAPTREQNRSKWRGFGALAAGRHCLALKGGIVNIGRQTPTRRAGGHPRRPLPN